jgi:hypothetical protein
MHEISALIHSPVFWFSAVLIGLIVNVFSNLVMRWLDKGWLKGRMALSERSKQAKSKRNKRVIELAENIDHLHHTVQKLNGYRFTALFPSSWRRG